MIFIIKLSLKCCINQSINHLPFTKARTQCEMPIVILQSTTPCCLQTPVLSTYGKMFSLTKQFQKIAESFSQFSWPFISRWSSAILMVIFLFVITWPSYGILVACKQVVAHGVRSLFDVNYHLLEILRIRKWMLAFCSINEGLCPGLFLAWQDPKKLLAKKWWGVDFVTLDRARLAVSPCFFF